jgi:superkiller protein 3
MRKRSRLGDVQFTEILYHAEAWLMRGVVLRNLQRYSEAIASFDKAIQITPDFQVAIENRQQALSQLKH